MATELEELLGFLSSPSPPIKRAAVDIVRGLTGSEDGMQSLARYSNVLLNKLSQLLGDPKEVSEPSAESLVNLSQNIDLAGQMISIGMIKTAMDLLYKPDSSIMRLLVMLLVNLTQLDAGIASLLQVDDEKMHGLYVMKLVRSFCRSPNEKQGDVFEHVGSILVNVSKMEAGRKILLDPKRGLLKQIIMQFDSTNTLRKKGVSGTIRNCCFDAENQLPNLLLTSEFLWPALILPVAGNKVYTKEDTSKMPCELASALSIEREPITDSDIRVQALEAIYLITLQEAGRRAFWSINGPRILQIGYSDEEDTKVMEAYERVGALGEICKAVICLEIASNKYDVVFDRQIAIKLSGLSERAYNRSFNSFQNVLGVQNNLDVRELAIQFGCVRIIPLVQKGLKLYKDRFLASLPVTRRGSTDFARPVFLAVAFYLCAKKHKLRVDKFKLIELCGTLESEFSSVYNSMVILCHDVFGVLKEKKDPKEVKGHRELLDVFPENRGYEDGGYTSDEAEPSSYKKRKTMEKEAYDDWKSTVMSSISKEKDKTVTSTTKRTKQARLNFTKAATDTPDLEVS